MQTGYFHCRDSKTSKPITSTQVGANSIRYTNNSAGQSSELPHHQGPAAGDLGLAICRQLEPGWAGPQASLLTPLFQIYTNSSNTRLASLGCGHPITGIDIDWAGGRGGSGRARCRQRGGRGGDTVKCRIEPRHCLVPGLDLDTRAWNECPSKAS